MTNMCSTIAIRPVPMRHSIVYGVNGNGLIYIIKPQKIDMLHAKLMLISCIMVSAKYQVEEDREKSHFICWREKIVFDFIF